MSPPCPCFSFRAVPAADSFPSAEWYVKLEQGGVVSPPAETDAALGRALQLDPVENESVAKGPIKS